MIEKLKAFYAVFRSGEMVADPVAWKKGQMTGGLVAGFLGACVATAKAFGYEIPLSDDQLLQIGGAIVAVFGVFNAGVTVASTNKFGLPAKPAEPSASGPDAGMLAPDRIPDAVQPVGDPPDKPTPWVPDANP